jgi:ComF family protein
VADIKFHGRLTSAPLLAALLARKIVAAHPPPALGDAGAAALPPAQALPEAIVPVPLSTRRLLRRGHDQAWLLAARVQAALGDAGHPIAFAGGALRRVRHTPAQSAQGQAARLRSLVGAFAVPAALPYRHVALLDDVFTTGATLDAAARALRAAGVARVDAWVVARTPGRADDTAGG